MSIVPGARPQRSHKGTGPGGGGKSVVGTPECGNARKRPQHRRAHTSTRARPSGPPSPRLRSATSALLRGRLQQPKRERGSSDQLTRAHEAEAEWCAICDKARAAQGHSRAVDSTRIYAEKRRRLQIRAIKRGQVRRLPRCKANAMSRRLRTCLRAITHDDGVTELRDQVHRLRRTADDTQETAEQRARKQVKDRLEAKASAKPSSAPTNGHLEACLPIPEVIDATEGYTVMTEYQGPPVMKFYAHQNRSGQCGIHLNVNSARQSEVIKRQTSFPTKSCEVEDDMRVGLCIDQEAANGADALRREEGAGGWVRVRVRMHDGGEGLGAERLSVRVQAQPRPPAELQRVQAVDRLRSSHERESACLRE
eukprot:6209341-Pleurochrysis_carterae.AAC.4